GRGSRRCPDGHRDRGSCGLARLYRPARRRMARVSRVALFGFLALPCAVAAARAAPPDRDVAETVARFESLRAGAAAPVAADTRLRHGHASVRLRSGRSAPVYAGSELTGFFFEGRGELEYTSTDPVEFPVVSYNARKAAGLAVEKGEKGLVVREEFEHLLW